MLGHDPLQPHRDPQRAYPLRPLVRMEVTPQRMEVTLQRMAAQGFYR